MNVALGRPFYHLTSYLTDYLHNLKRLMTKYLNSCVDSFPLNFIPLMGESIILFMEAH